MTDQDVREFVEMLAVPEPADPPPCPLCGHSHPLETMCVPRMETIFADAFEAAGLRE